MPCEINVINSKQNLYHDHQQHHNHHHHDHFRSRLTYEKPGVKLNLWTSMNWSSANPELPDVTTSWKYISWDRDTLEKLCGWAFSSQNIVEKSALIATKGKLQILQLVMNWNSDQNHAKNLCLYLRDDLKQMLWSYYLSIGHLWSYYLPNLKKRSPVPKCQSCSQFKDPDPGL